jgi:hypothetical protein
MRDVEIVEATKSGHRNASWKEPEAVPIKIEPLIFSSPPGLTRGSMDGRVKPGHDGKGVMLPIESGLT